MILNVPTLHEKIIAMRVITIACAFFATGSCMVHQVGNKTVEKIFADPNVVALAEAACRGDVDGIERALRAGADVNANGLENVPPLMWALSCENLEGMRALLKNGANPNHHTDDGTTPVHFAATYNNPIFLRLLLENNGDPNAADNRGETPLTRALSAFQSTGDVQNFDILLEAGGDPSLRNVTGDTVVDNAVMLGQYDLALHVMRLGEPPRDCRRPFGLNYAAMGVSSSMA